MIYIYTGNPGHGKSLHAIDAVLKYVAEGRLVYVCNVADFQYEKAGCLRMEPDDFKDWMNFLPDGAVCFVDEVYEHGMLPKRPPGSKVPAHVEQLAKHRHRGIDFIFVCQSPARQIDDFVHDLIEWHIHVRRFYGLPFVRLKKFSYMERSPVKASATSTQFVPLPKRPRGLYKSTVMDTSEARVPWYFIAFAVALPAVAFGAWHQFGEVEEQFQGSQQPIAVQGKKADGTEHGAPATGEGTAAADPATPTRANDYWGWLTPRIAGQPWTAPAYDKLTVPMQAPRIFCASTGAGEDADGHHRPPSCSCVTEQGTRYSLPDNHCRMLAREGQYEPFRDEVIGDRRRLDSETQRRQLYERDAARTAGPSTFEPGSVITGDQMAGYGDIAVGTAP